MISDPQMTERAVTKRVAEEKETWEKKKLAGAIPLCTGSGRRPLYERSGADDDLVLPPASRV
jgi:hypothetical protein